MEFMPIPPPYWVLDEAEVAKRQAKQARPQPAAPTRMKDPGEQAYMEPTPYFAQPEPSTSEPRVANSDPVTWPKMSFVEHYELVQAAAAELRRRGLA